MSLIPYEILYHHIICHVCNQRHLLQNEPICPQYDNTCPYCDKRHSRRDFSTCTPAITFQTSTNITLLLYANGTMISCKDGHAISKTNIFTFEERIKTLEERIKTLEKLSYEPPNDKLPHGGIKYQHAKRNFEVNQNKQLNNEIGDDDDGPLL